MWKIGPSKHILLSDFIDPKRPVADIASTDVSFTKEKSKVSDAIELILSGFRRVPVVGNDNYVKGIISNIDILDFLGAEEKYKLFKKRKVPFNTPVESLMTTGVRVIEKSESIDNVLKIFKEQGKGAYPVVSKK